MAPERRRRVGRARGLVTDFEADSTMPAGESRRLFELGRQLDGQVRTMMVYCRCGLKVLEVTRSAHMSPLGAGYTFGALDVSPSGAQAFTEYRRGITLDRTYTWSCPRGHSDSRRLEWFLRAWPAAQENPASARRVVRVTLGPD